MPPATPRSVRQSPPVTRAGGYIAFVVLLAFGAWALVSMDNVMLGLAVPALAPAMHLSLSIKKYEPRRDLEELAPSRLLAGNEG